MPWYQPTCFRYLYAERAEHLVSHLEAYHPRQGEIADMKKQLQLAGQNREKDYWK